MDKEERKAYIKEQRKKLKENPSMFLKENVIDPTLNYWKEKPLHAIGTFIFWVALYYLLFGGIQAVNNDMIYCDASIDEYDGKLMYVYNDFVNYYNNNAQKMQDTSPYATLKEQELQVQEFNTQYTMYCDYNLTKWNSEPIGDRIGTIGYGFKKILLKES